MTDQAEPTMRRSTYEMTWKTLFEAYEAGVIDGDEWYDALDDLDKRAGVWVLG